METSWSGVVIGDGPSPLLMSCRKRVEGRERERERREIEREREREREAKRLQCRSRFIIHGILIILIKKSKSHWTGIGRGVKRRLH